MYRLNSETALVLTVDFFPPIVDDPFLFGTIAAANSLSDVYAMGGRPLAALNIAAFPADLPSEILAQILAGGSQKAAEAGVPVLGGHTIDDAEPKFGMAVTGLVHPDEVVTNAGACVSDMLVLTKPLGTGIITTANKAGKAHHDVLASAIQIMATLNDHASQAMLEVGVHAATDITGYGLAGHLKEMVQASRVAARISRSALPVIPGALELLEQDIVPGGTHRNLSAVSESFSWDNSLSQKDMLFISDAQTSGGLLIAVTPDRVDHLLARLKERGTPAAAVIGEIVEGPTGKIIVTP